MDAEAWDERYRTAEMLWSVGPNKFVLDVYTLMLGLETDDHRLIRQVIDNLTGNPLIPPDTRTMTRNMDRLLDTPDGALQELHRVFDQAVENEDMSILPAIPPWAAYFGDHELGLAAFRELFRNHVIVTRILWHPIIGPVRRLQGFREVVVEVGLAEYWRATGNWADNCHPSGTEDFNCE